MTEDEYHVLQKAVLQIDEERAKINENITKLKLPIMVCRNEQS